MMQNLRLSALASVDERARPPVIGMSRRQFLFSCAYVVITALACAGLSAAAALVPAPVGVIPVVALCAVLPPMMATWHVAAIAPAWRMNGDRHAAIALAQLRRSLDALPETEHPLGL